MRHRLSLTVGVLVAGMVAALAADVDAFLSGAVKKIGRASCRERV